MYDHGNVLRVETTINQPKEFAVPIGGGRSGGAEGLAMMQRGVADTHGGRK